MTTRADEVSVERTESGAWVGMVNGRQVVMVFADRPDYWIEDELRGARNLEQHARERAMGCEAVLAARRAEREAALVAPRAERERSAAVPSEDYRQEPERG